MNRPNFTFRQAQAAFDVIELAKRADDALLVAIGGERLPKIVREQGARFEKDEDLEALEAVSLKAAKPEHPETCTLALAIFLADALQDGLSHGTLEGYAETALQAIHGAPRLTRAALVRAFATTRDLGGMGVLPPELPFAPDENLTCDRDTLIAPLCDLARNMDSPTRDFVSEADYGSDAEKHREALSRVLLRETCLLEKDEYWHPSEVVELIAHVPGQPGFLECTALLMANSVQDNDNQGYFDYRFESIGAAYFDQPGRAAPVIAGLRYLYESDSHFLSYYTRQYDPVLHPERMIPLVDFPAASS